MLLWLGAKESVSRLKITPAPGDQEGIVRAFCPGPGCTAHVGWLCLPPAAADGKQVPYMREVPSEMWQHFAAMNLPGPVCLRSGSCVLQTRRR